MGHPGPAGRSRSGSDPDEVDEVLAGEASSDPRFGQDESRARALGAIRGPVLRIDEAFGVSGARAPDVLLGALEQAWAASHPITHPMHGDRRPGRGAACTDDSCAI